MIRLSNVHKSFGTQKVLDGLSLEIPDGQMTAIIVAVPLGVWAALKQDGLPDYGLRSVAILLNAVPGFWIAVLVMLLVFLAAAAVIMWGVLGDLNHEIRRLKADAPAAAERIEQSGRFGPIARDFRLHERESSRSQSAERQLWQYPGG
jgi:hypothetical protein